MFLKQMLNIKLMLLIRFGTDSMFISFPVYSTTFKQAHLSKLNFSLDFRTCLQNTLNVLASVESDINWCSAAFLTTFYEKTFHQNISTSFQTQNITTTFRVHADFTTHSKISIEIFNPFFWPAWSLVCF